jgi:hypothetical protein
MKKLFAILIAMAVPLAVFAQSQTLASTLQIYVFPKQGQDATQQSKDEAACYDWAVSNSGSDPFKVADQKEADAQQAKAEQQAAQQAGAGSGAKSAVRGAAAGALIGEIANDDAGDGAAWGAALGAVHGRRKGHQQQQQAQQQANANEEQRTQATEQQETNFKNAFSACLEAQNYMVKF